MFLYQFGLICNYNIPDYNYFKKVLNKYEEGECINSFRNIYYEIVEHELNEDYFYLYIRFGDGSTYSPEVVNMENQIVESNPRKKTQIELPNELFVFYGFKNAELLISELNKKSLLKKYFIS